MMRRSWDGPSTSLSTLSPRSTNVPRQLARMSDGAHGPTSEPAVVVKVSLPQESDYIVSIRIHDNVMLYTL